MSNNRPDHGFGRFVIGMLRGIFGWFAGALGICLVAGGIGTGAGVYMGLSLPGALMVGGFAIILVLAVWLFLMSGGDLF